MNNFYIEQSTLEYLTSREIRLATHTLLNSDVEELPPGLSWEDVPKFYSALRAASLVKIEYAITIERFWTAVWADATGSRWQEMSPDIQGEFDDEASNSVDECFDEKRFIRCFETVAPRHILYASVSISETGFAIGFALHRGNLPKHLIQELDHFAFKKGDGLWTDPALVKVSGSPDIAVLSDLARSAITAASRRIS